MTDERFSKIYNFIKSIKDVSADIIQTYQNKIAYKWIKRYRLLTIDTSNVLAYNQTLVLKKG